MKCFASIIAPSLPFFLSLSASTTIDAFIVSSPSSTFRHNHRSVVTGGAATLESVAATVDAVDAAPTDATITKDEDLRLTLQVIMDHVNRSTTVSKEQFIQQIEEEERYDSKKAVTTEIYDVSIPYTARTKLAYKDYCHQSEEDRHQSYDEFEIQFLKASVQDVISKRRRRRQENRTKDNKMQPKVATISYDDVSVDYMAAAKLAYQKQQQSSDSSSSVVVSYEDFEKKYVSDAIRDVIAKNNNENEGETEQHTQQPSSSPVVVNNNDDDDSISSSDVSMLRRILNRVLPRRK